MVKLKKDMSKLVICAVLLLVGFIFIKNDVNAETNMELKIGETYSGTINTDNASDEYILNLKESGRVSFIINVTDAETLYVYDADGNELKPDFFFGYGDCNASLNLKTGKYILKLCQYAHCDSTYTFTTNFTSAKETFSYKNDFISDITSKSAVPFRTKINCQLAMSEKYDYYKISIPSKGELTFDLETNISQAQFSILDNDGNKIDEFYGHNSTKQYSKMYSLNKGTYYLKVERSFDRLGTYSFKLAFTNDAIETFSVKKESSKSFSATAKKAGAISGYQIKYKKNNGTWKTVNVKSKKDLNKTISKLSKGAEYQVKIRTYYTYKEKKLYSDWSKIKKVKLS